MKFVMKMRAANKKKFRQGTEYGSAVWGTEKDIEPYMDFKEKDNNVILTQTEGLTMGKPSHPKYARNKNILVIGGSGSGKTRFFVKPNLMQMHSSYIVTDPKGTALIECGIYPISRTESRCSIPLISASPCTTIPLPISPKRTEKRIF